MSDQEPKHIEDWQALKDAVFANCPVKVEAFVLVAIDATGKAYYGASFPTSEPYNGRMVGHLHRAASECQKAVRAVERGVQAAQEQAALEAAHA